MKSKLIFLVVLIFLVAGFFSGRESQRNKIQFLELENRRISGNNESLVRNIEFYVSKAGNQAAKVKSLTYRVEEFKQNEQRMTKTIKDLNLKLKNTKSAIQIGTSSKVKIETKIQYVDTNKCFNYVDKFNTVTGCVIEDSVKIQIHYQDSLTAIVSKIPKHRFLWWTWGVKAVELDIVSENPNTKFTYLKYITLE